MNVSVIIPVYRVSAYIERCVASVAHQTFTDVECLLVDDASDDDSMERVTVWLKQYTGPIHFRTLFHDRNLGLSAARNTGIIAAQGDYLFFLDGDDALPADCLEHLVQFVSRFPDVDIVQGSTEISGPDSNPFRYRLSAHLPDFSRDSAWIGRSLLERRSIPVTSWNKLINRNWLMSNNLLFKEGIVHEDEHWTFMAAAFVQSIAFCKHITYSHFDNEGSIMRSQVDKSIQSWMIILRTCVSYERDSLYRIRRKVLMEVGFCNVVRIVKKGSKETIRENIQVLRHVMAPLFSDIRSSGSWLERWLLTWFHLPLPLLAIACSNHVKGIYFRLLDTVNA